MRGMKVIKVWRKHIKNCLIEGRERKEKMQDKKIEK
jgi:hypothetical protein